MEWSNPEWLKWLAVATTILAGAHLLMPVHWAVEYWVDLLEVDVSTFSYQIGLWLWRLLWPVLLLLCGIGMCLLGRSERRYPDDLWFVRWILIAMGVCQMALAGVAVYLVWRIRMVGTIPVPPYWVYWISSYARGFWPLWIGDSAALVVVGAFGMRGKWRKSKEYFTVVVAIWWLCCLGRFVCYLPIGETWVWLVFDFVWKWGYSLSLCVWLIWASRNFLQHRREAIANWVSD